MLPMTMPAIAPPESHSGFKTVIVINLDGVVVRGVRGSIDRDSLVFPRFDELHRAVKEIAEAYSANKNALYKYLLEKNKS